MLRDIVRGDATLVQWFTQGRTVHLWFRSQMQWQFEFEVEDWKGGRMGGMPPDPDQSFDGRS